LVNKSRFAAILTYWGKRARNLIFISPRAREGNFIAEGSSARDCLADVTDVTDVRKKEFVKREVGRRKKEEGKRKKKEGRRKRRRVRIHE
jgi:hypothetical protein